MSSDSPSARLSDHLPEYLIEALGLGLFMVSAGSRASYSARNTLSKRCMMQLRAELLTLAVPERSMDT